MQLKEGTLLQNGKYRIEKVLGQGSFGITYLATTKIKVGGNLGKMDTIANVAIKEFFMRDLNGREGSSVTLSSKGELFNDYKSKFVKEARNLNKLNHPNIIKVLDLFEANNTYYYVMNYCKGGSLDDKIKHSKCMSEREAVRYAYQIGMALKYMHSQKMLHLDLKPGNVVLDDNGDAVLIDFGLSKQFDSNGEPEGSTTIGLGTSGYAPMEQGNYDGKGFPVTMDVYAFGATIYKMLTGKCASSSSVLFNEGFPYKELREKGVSESLIEVIAQAMSPMVKDRFQSVEELLKAFPFSNTDEWTDIDISVEPDPAPVPGPGPTPNPEPVPSPKPVPGPIPKPKSWIMYAVLSVVLVVVGYFVYDGIAEKRYRTMLLDQMSYLALLEEGDKLLEDNKYSESVKKYEQAQIYEKKYTGTEYSKEFDKGASSKIKAANEAAEYAKYKGHEWVDLGLPSGIKWATCNVGASRPEEYGYYFAWGETREKSSYDEDNSVTFRKDYGDIGGDSRYDAAKANWGGDWRMPTYDELNELNTKCTWTWTTQNGVNGYNVEGPNGNSIFLPAAGRRLGTSLNYTGEYVSYWSSSPYESGTDGAYGLNINGGLISFLSYRYYGRSVRPVSE